MRIHSVKNKVIWITGASSGIGEALAYAYAHQGARIILSARNKEALEKVREKCAQRNNKIRILPLDLSKLGTLNKKAKQALKFFGKIDIMVHNAGVASRDLAANINIRTDQKIMNTNYFGAVVLTKALLPSMFEQKSGHFLVVSSVSGIYGVPKLSSYSASKHALHGFFESLRAEIAKDNIKITMVVPGFVKTNITANALTGDGSKYGKMMQVHKRGMDPAYVAATIIDAASKNKEEVLIGKLESLGVYCKRIFPALFTVIIRNHPMKKIRAVKNFFNLKKHIFRYEH